MAKRHFKNLDGLRFIAATTVAVSHFELTKRNHNLPFLNNRFFENSAQIAVTFFFVLSGFLIMWWFLEETGGKTSKLNLKSFYMRRIFRTWPLYYLIVFVCAFIRFFDGTFDSDLSAGNRFIGFLFFMPNTADVLYGSDVYLGQTWSLAVEEFFYLFFPVLLLKIPERKLLKSLFALFALSVILSTVFNPVFFALFLKNVSSIHAVYLIKYFERYRIYSFLAGVFAAHTLYFHKVALSKDYLKKLSVVYPLAALTVILLFLCGVTFSFLTNQVYSILFAACLYLAALANKSNRLLDSPAMVLFGKTSYGIYMLHMFVIIWLINHHFFISETASSIRIQMQSFILFLIVTFLLSYLSYKLFENPIRTAARKWLLAKTQKKET